MQKLNNVAAIATILAAISTSPSYGQNERRTQPPPATQLPTRPDCPPDGAVTPRPGETTGSPPLSDRLSQSKGVICPPKGVDPGIVNEPPRNNAPTPVIPPPGTPGGDPGSQPK